MSRRAKPHLRCADCRMHRSLCICGLLPRIATRTRVLLVLHQLEVVKPTNTGLVDAQPLEAALAGDVQPVLLYPHPSATPLGAWPPSEKPLLLVVPDGTWPQASKTRRRIPALSRLPCVSLPAPPAPVDRLRAPPLPGRMATLEAVATALGILEGAPVADALLRVYRIMTERTLWTNGRLASGEVTGGIPAGARPHDPLSLG
jgi:DTW domain-containing protein YfiP